jgi:type IV pilus assembly protein PilY1
LAILVGSGDREAPYDTTVSNVFYMIKDDVAPGTCTNCGMTDAGLCERNTVANSTAVGQCTLLCSGQTEVNSTTGLTCFQSCLAQKTPCAIDHDGDPATPMVSTYTYDPDNDPSTINSVTVVLADRGWKYTYPTVGEKTVNAPLTLGGVAFFGTNIPQSLVNASSCGGLGEARLYQVEFSTGTPASDPNGSGISSYYALKSGGGFPPSPVGTVVTTDDGKTVEVVLSGPQIQKPPTVPIQKRNRIYWYKVLDR